MTTFLSKACMLHGTLGLSQFFLSWLRIKSSELSHLGVKCKCWMQPCHSRPTLGCRLYAWDFHPWEKRSKTPRFCTQSVHTHRKNNPSKKSPHPTLGNRFLWTLLKQIFSPILVPKNVSNEKLHVESMCWTLFYWLRLPKRVRSKFADYDCFDIAWGILWPCGTQNTAYQHSEPPWMSKTRVSGPIWTQCWMGYL